MANDLVSRCKVTELRPSSALALDSQVAGFIDTDGYDSHTFIIQTSAIGSRGMRFDIIHSDSETGGVLDNPERVGGGSIAVPLTYEISPDGVVWTGTNKRTGSTPASYNWPIVISNQSAGQESQLMVFGYSHEKRYASIYVDNDASVGGGTGVSAYMMCFQENSERSGTSNPPQGPNSGADV